MLPSECILLFLPSIFDDESKSEKRPEVDVCKKYLGIQKIWIESLRIALCYHLSAFCFLSQVFLTISCQTDCQIRPEVDVCKKYLGIQKIWIESLRIALCYHLSAFCFFSQVFLTMSRKVKKGRKSMCVKNTWESRKSGQNP